MAPMFGSGDYYDIGPAGSTWACPVCGTPCMSHTAAQAHCRQSWNSKSCSICRGSGSVYGQRCSACEGTGRVRF